MLDADPKKLYGLAPVRFVLTVVVVGDLPLLVEEQPLIEVLNYTVTTI